MKKHVVSFILACLLIVSMCPVSVFAAGKTTEGQVTYFDDGSYLTVTIVKDWESALRASKSITGAAVYDYTSSNGITQWKATLKATFTYDGSTSRCTSVDSPSVVIYDNTWSLDSKSCSKSGNTATGNITMAKKLLLGNGKVPITLTLSCDKNGNLS